jgi:hypothetical protein
MKLLRLRKCSKNLLRVTSFPPRAAGIVNAARMIGFQVPLKVVLIDWTGV